MICAAGHEAVTYTIPHPFHATMIEDVQCAPCARHLFRGVWTRMAGYCDGCNTPTWRFVTHPAHGQPVLLWPKGDTVFAMIVEGEGTAPVSYRDYCPQCVPEFGAPAKRALERDGQPLPTGPCMGHVRPRDRYPEKFTDAHGVFLAAWLVDALGLDGATRDALLAVWEEDRKR